MPDDDSRDLADTRGSTESRGSSDSRDSTDSRGSTDSTESPASTQRSVGAQGADGSDAAPFGGRIDRRTALVSLAAVVAAAGCSSSVVRSPSGSAGTPARSTAPPASTTASSVTNGSSATPASPTSPATTAQSATPAVGAPRVAPEPAVAKRSGLDIVHGPRGRREVALTFHGAGDLSLTEQILRDCADHDARVTVFAVGLWLAATPSIGRKILAGGHELGNHTWSHQQMPALSARVAQDEVRRGADALRRATGSRGWWFRPSGTPHSTATIREAARRSGYQRCVSYDVDPQDYRDPGAALVVSRTLAQVRPGSIVSLHCGHAGTVQALPLILRGLTARNLLPVTLSWLLRD